MAWKYGLPETKNYTLEYKIKLDQLERLESIAESLKRIADKTDSKWIDRLIDALKSSGKLISTIEPAMQAFHKRLGNLEAKQEIVFGPIERKPDETELFKKAAQDFQPVSIATQRGKSERKIIRDAIVFLDAIKGIEGMVSVKHLYEKNQDLIKRLGSLLEQTAPVESHPCGTDDDIPPAHEIKEGVDGPVVCPFITQKDEAKWPEVDTFALIMKERLEANKAKGGWKDCTAGYLTKRLDEETRELTHTLVEGNLDNIRHEAADVANFAIMIADNAESIVARLTVHEGEKGEGK